MNATKLYVDCGGSGLEEVPEDVAEEVSVLLKDLEQSKPKALNISVFTKQADPSFF